MAESADSDSYYGADEVCHPASLIGKINVIMLNGTGEPEPMTLQFPGMISLSLYWLRYV